MTWSAPFIIVPFNISRAIGTHMGTIHGIWCNIIKPHLLNKTSFIKQSQIAIIVVNKANLRDLIAATGLSNLTQIGFKSSIFQPVSVTLKFDGWPKKTIGHHFYATLSFLHHFEAIGEFILWEHLWNLKRNSYLTSRICIWKYDRYEMAAILVSVSMC